MAPVSPWKPALIGFFAGGIFLLVLLLILSNTLLAPTPVRPSPSPKSS